MRIVSIGMVSVLLLGSSLTLQAVTPGASAPVNSLLETFGDEPLNTGRVLYNAFGRAEIEDSDDFLAAVEELKDNKQQIAEDGEGDGDLQIDEGDSMTIRIEKVSTRLVENATGDDADSMYHQLLDVIDRVENDDEAGNPGNSLNNRLTSVIDEVQTDDEAGAATDSLYKRVTDATSGVNTAIGGDGSTFARVDEVGALIYRDADDVPSGTADPADSLETRVSAVATDIIGFEDTTTMPETDRDNSLYTGRGARAREAVRADGEGTGNANDSLETRLDDVIKLVDGAYNISGTDPEVLYTAFNAKILLIRGALHTIATGTKEVTAAQNYNNLTTLEEIRAALQADIDAP